MGTKIQSQGLPNTIYHQGKFADWPVSLVGNNDVLCLTAPDVIAGIHRCYIDAGADIISTNTFSSNRISQREYSCEHVARDMAYAGARLAKSVADEYERRIWVAGSMGPTSKSLTLASDMNKPAERLVEFDELAAAYEEQAEALLEGGCDVLLLETCYDALNTKAALYAISRLNERLHLQTPVMVSATINDRSGRTLTGQTVASFYISVSHYPYLLSFGLNCSFGVTDLVPFVEQLSARVPVNLSLHPNAGLPNEMGEYEELPAYTASHLQQMAQAGLLNIAGGCCGTDERHIAAIKETLDGIAPRRVPEADQQLWTSGLEPLLIDRRARNFTNIGERTNVAGSKRFARLIAAKSYDEALSVARNQIDGGAEVIDINMDDAMLDSRAEMQTFCRHIAGDPAVGRVTMMIDSSDWPTIVAGLKNVQGKCIVNSISLRGGEKAFLEKARELHRLGAAVVVMAFDEDGQATTYERKIAIAERAYRLLTSVGIPAEDIIFDVNILSVGTGVREHQDYAASFIRAVEWIKHNLPHAKTSGGVSNLSFAFRGNNKVRGAMHSVFLYHAIRAGLDMAIVNPTMLQLYDAIPPALLKAVEDVVLNRDDGATERLIALAATMMDEAEADKTAEQQESWRDRSVDERLFYALSKGDSEHLADDILEALREYGSPIKVIEQPLMHAMEQIGQLFGEGKMFLPQVVKSAKVMKDAVAVLQPYIDEAAAADTMQQRSTVLLATANGDVHDIGKNIVGIVLGCNGLNVIDLGVMVPNEIILEQTLQHKPCLVGISGLITPSLKEMEQLCRLFQREGLKVPIVFGGATTSAVHTAVKLAPLYDGLVIYGGDASHTSMLAKRLEMDADAVATQVRAEQERLRQAYEESHAELTPYAEANRKARVIHTASMPSECKLPALTAADKPDLQAVAALIDWRMFLLFWGFKGETLPQLLVNPEAERTLAAGKEYLQRALDSDAIRVQALLRYELAVRRGNDIVLTKDGTVLPMLRSQTPQGGYRCLADYYDEQQPAPLGLFVVTAAPVVQPEVEEERLMCHALCARLAEACAVWLSREVEPAPLRVAFGYATCPDHSLKRIVFDQLDAERQLDITLNDHYSIQPSTSVCGLLITGGEARYFSVGRIDREQLSDYCRRRGISAEEGERLLDKYITQ